MATRNTDVHYSTDPNGNWDGRIPHYGDHEGTRQLVWEAQSYTHDALGVHGPFFGLYVSRPLEVRNPPERGGIHWANISCNHIGDWQLYMDKETAVSCGQSVLDGFHPISIGKVSEAEARDIVNTMFKMQW